MEATAHTESISSFSLSKPRHLDKHAYLVGNPIAHSKSPALHHAIYSTIDKRWGQILAETDDLEGFLDFLRTDETAMGSGVTMPFKVAVIPYLDGLEDAGRAVGAVNTIFFRTGADGARNFIGTNTDVIGIRDAIKNNSGETSFIGKPGLIYGGGGTCRAAVYALRNLLGCSEVYIVNRDKREVDAVVAEYSARNDADGIRHIASVKEAVQICPPAVAVSAVPDFEPRTADEVLARQILETLLLRGKSGSPLLEMCYHPNPNTAISRLATAAQWKVVGGVEAMVGQGIAQAELWTGLCLDKQTKDGIRQTIGNTQAKQPRL